MGKPRGRGTSIYSLLLCTERNPHTITITMAVLAILGFMAAIPASIYVFGVHKRRDTYHVNQGNAWFPLTSKRAEEPLGEPPS